VSQVKQVYLVMDNGDLIIPNVDSHKRQEFEFRRDEPYHISIHDPIPTELRTGWSRWGTPYEPEAILNLKVGLDEKENYTTFHDAADTFNEGVSEYLNSKIKQLETIKEKLD